MKNLWEIEKNLYDLGYVNVLGIDEAGRGPLAGPLVVAGVIFDKNIVISEVNDSKKLSEKKREYLFDVIINNAKHYTIEFVSSKNVDIYNPYQASKMGMIKCINNLKNLYDYVLTDAMKLDLNIKYQAIIKGDSQCFSIAAASILAKVSRDRYMRKLDSMFPLYGFSKHKGYGTKKHLDAISLYGIINEHRVSYKPIKKYII